PEVSGIVVEDVGGARGFGDGAIVEDGGLGEALEAIEGRAEQTKGKRIVGVRRNLLAQFPFSGREVAPLHPGDAVAQGGRLGNGGQQSDEQECKLRRRHRSYKFRKTQSGSANAM